MADRLNLVYVVGTFPSLSETFVQDEVTELQRGGDRLVVCSLDESCALSDAPTDPEVVRPPAGIPGFVTLVLSILALFLKRPLGVVSALAWAVRSLTDERDALRSFAYAAFFIRKVGTDVDHLHAHFATVPASTVLMMSRMSGIRFSFTGHAFDVVAAQRPRQLARKVKAAAFVVTTTGHMRDFIRDHVERELHDSVIAIPSGIDLSFFTRRRGDPNTSTILAVARLVEKKGIDDLIEACALVVRAGVDLRCVVAGDGPLLEGLVRQRERLGLEDHIRFAGAVSRAEIRDLLAQSSVFALPCRMVASGDRDGFPIATLEAMAVGVPIITTPVGGIPEVITHGDTGLVVAPGEPKALADALRSLLGDAQLRGDLAKRARAVVEDRDLATQVGKLRARFASAGEKV